jgi:serine/threonine protein kinase
VPSPPEIGSSASSYQILARLAVGGMAEIFLARAATGAGVARFVVLKRVLRERARDFQFLRMFLDEARLAAQLQHPNIAQVYDVGKLGDSYFFTMEYVHGVTVRELIQKLAGKPMPIACVLAIAQGAASGLHHAHERIGVDGKPLNIVHRDVSPSNLLVGFEGHVKVVDFGIAKAASREHETQSGTVRGKIGYLSPEQASGEDVDRRSDVFSFGILLWEMLTGKRLYKRASDFASMAAIIGDPPPAPSTERPDIPPALDALVLRALAKAREDRFQTAQELVDAVEVIATTTGATISTAALGRLVRDVFGVRPEPWVALQRPDDGGGTFTVTAEPVPKELVIPPANDVDRRLAAVTDLSSTVAVEDARPTVQVMVVDRDPTATPSTDQRPMRPPTPVPRPPSAGPALRPSPFPTLTPLPARRSQLPLVIGGGAFLLAVALAIAAAIALSPDKVARDQAPVAVPMVAEPTVDAAIAIAPVPDAAPAPEPIVDEPVIVAQPDEPPKQRRRRQPTARELFADCKRGAAAKSPTDCTLLACQFAEANKATAWFARVPPAKRGMVSAKCRDDGVKLAKPPAVNCDLDPGRCQF